MNQLVKQMNTFFDPKAVAVIGASRRTMKAGHVIFKNAFQHTTLSHVINLKIK